MPMQPKKGGKPGMMDGIDVVNATPVDDDPDVGAPVGIGMPVILP